MSGWIKLHRQLTEHWIWNNSDYLKWWLDILMEVNHTDQKTLIKGILFECKRGEKLYSLDTWAKRWKTNKSKVRRFFDLLQKDEMILLKNETITTRLTVCKYDSYQDERNANETETKRKRNASETQTTPIQECNNDNNEKNENILALPKFSFYHSLINYGADKDLVSDWLKVRKTKRATNTETAFNKFIAQVEESGYTLNDVLIKCIEKSWGGFNAEWYKKQIPLNGIGKTNQKLMKYDD